MISRSVHKHDKVVSCGFQLNITATYKHVCECTLSSSTPVADLRSLTSRSSLTPVDRIGDKLQLSDRIDIAVRVRLSSSWALVRVTRFSRTTWTPLLWSCEWVWLARQQNGGRETGRPRFELGVSWSQPCQGCSLNPAWRTSDRSRTTSGCRPQSAFPVDPIKTPKTFLIFFQLFVSSEVWGSAGLWRMKLLIAWRTISRRWTKDTVGLSCFRWATKFGRSWKGIAGIQLSILLF